MTPEARATDGKRAVFVDRDGVIIRTAVRDGRPYAITALDQLEILPGVAEALARLRRRGYLVIVATNQPEVARGLVARETVEAMHRELLARLAIDDIKACYEVDGPSALCYKPRPKMLLDAAGEHGIDLARSFMVGDRWRDVGAGRAAGCFSIFIDLGYNEPRPESPDAVVGSLPEAVELILSRS